MSSSYRDDGKGKRWTGSQDRRESIRAPLLAKIQACYTFYGLALTCGQILEHRTHEKDARTQARRRVRAAASRLKGHALPYMNTAHTASVRT